MSSSAITSKKISRIEFGVLSDEEMRKLSHLNIVNRELYRPNTRVPVPHGVLDKRLGTSEKAGICATCGLKLADCVGHYGYIKLELPVFHIGYFKAIIEVLQRICKTCGRILLDEEQKELYLKRLRNKNLETLKRKAIAKQLHNLCKKVTKCPHCTAPNGTVKKISAIKILHEKFKAKANADRASEFYGSFEEAVQHNPDLKPYITRAQEDMTPLNTRELFNKIPDDEIELLDMDPKCSHPSDLILTHMLVPPVCIRPSVPSSGPSGSNEDDLTMNLTQIVHMNSIIKSNIEKGAMIQTIMEDWDYLQLLCAMYINSELPGFPAGFLPQNKPTRSLCQRLKGKQGRFRGNLSGKRVDFSGRTVISPDPNLKINQVAVPELIAKVLTYPERAQQHNIEKLRRLIINGPDVHPGANFVESGTTGMKRYLKFGDREEIARNLKIGDIVERHLEDDDVVLFNRQPSLHKLSIMCHRAKVLPYRTLRFNECVCTPYNADFDGDEMNLHLPQTEEARAEALTLMTVLENMITPRNAEPLVSATQDFLTAGYLMTRKNMFFDRAQFCMLISYMDINVSRVDLPPPTIVKPIELWTGKQLFSILVKPNKETEVFVNLETKARNYSDRDQTMCPNDGWVLFKNSELLSGNLDKSTLGGGSKNSLFYFLIRNYSTEYAAECMSRVAKVTSRWLMNQGFSIGINDVTPSEKLITKKQSLLEVGYSKCDTYIRQYNEGKLAPQPGCNADQTIEAVLNGTLSKIRDDAGEICLKELHWLNAPLIMAVSGSKGSNINISQMVACVGQQTVSGSRIQNGFLDRTLPHFAHKSRAPEAKGFVANSFYSGLTPTEFFFHTMAGREGLVDTAVKTAETGYMQRRLMKALEDLSIQYDNTVRNASGGIVQFKYGDDALDPVYMEGANGRPINLQRLIVHIQNMFPFSHERGLLPCEIRDWIAAYVKQDAVKALFSELFIKEISDFINKQADDYAALRVKLELDDGNDREAYESFIKNIEHDEVKSVHEKIAQKAFRLTESQLEKYLEYCVNRYTFCVCEPGSAVGAIGAQSIGEPGTQMTLKTFHFAGVASMNVTQGVPRIREIIDASKNISTPIITAELVANKSETAARIVKGRVEKTTLGQIAEYIKNVYAPGQCFLSIKLDLAAIQALQLDITPASVVNAILSTPKLKVKEKYIRTQDDNKVRIYPADSQREKMFHIMHHLRNALPNVIVQGIPAVGRAVISKKDKGDEYNLLVEGLSLLQVMGTPGVVGTHTKSNHIIEVESALGIEAARRTIMNEIQYTMSSHGMSIDSRHMMLLADVMTFKGEILGITRYGVGKMKDSVLMLASFEKTTDHLFDAAVHSRKDDVVGVSECIIMGIPIPLGTGLFKLMQKVDIERKPPRKPLFLSHVAT